MIDWTQNQGIQGPEQIKPQRPPCAGNWARSPEEPVTRTLVLVLVVVGFQ